MTQEFPGTNPSAVIKAYEIVRWLIGHVGKFPRSHRFVLGERIESRMLGVVELLIRAAYSQDKKAPLTQANTDLQVLRLLVRLGKDLGFTSISQYAFISGELVDLGRQIGGWAKAQPH